MREILTCPWKMMKRIQQSKIQTGSNKNNRRFKRGDKHPIESDLYFHRYNSSTSTETWATAETLKKENEKKVKWYITTDQTAKKRKRYNEDEEYRDYIRLLSRESKAKPNNRERANKVEALRRQRLGKKHIQAVQKRAMAKKPEYYRELGRKRAREYHYRRDCKTHKLSVEDKEHMRVIYKQARRVNECLQTHVFDVDHITPLNRKGLHEPTNLQLAPASWNRSKQDKNSDLWVCWYKNKTE